MPGKNRSGAQGWGCAYKQVKQLISKMSNTGIVDEVGCGAPWMCMTKALERGISLNFAIWGKHWETPVTDFVSKRGNPPPPPFTEFCKKWCFSPQKHSFWANFLSGLGGFLYKISWGKEPRIKPLVSPRGKEFQNKSCLSLHPCLFGHPTKNVKHFSRREKLIKDRFTSLRFEDYLNYI